MEQLGEGQSELRGRDAGASGPPGRRCRGDFFPPGRRRVDRAAGSRAIPVASPLDSAGGQPFAGRHVGGRRAKRRPLRGDFSAPLPGFTAPSCRARTGVGRPGGWLSTSIRWRASWTSSSRPDWPRRSGVDFRYQPAATFQYAGELSGASLAEPLLLFLLALLLAEQIVAYWVGDHPRDAIGKGGAG